MHLWGLIAGITITFSISVGIVSFAISHTIGSNKTRISYAVSNGDAKAGQSTCVNVDGLTSANKRFLGCNPLSTTVMENTQSLNLSPGDPIALSINRSNGQARLNVGVSASAKDPSGWVRVGVSATEQFGGADALSIIDSAPVRTILPDTVNKKAHTWLGEPKPVRDEYLYKLLKDYRKQADLCRKNPKLLACAICQQ